MKYGRQRWKLKGKIEVNGKQSWDGEETVFLPLIVGFISIKVSTVLASCGLPGAKVDNPSGDLSPRLLPSHRLLSPQVPDEDSCSLRK